MSPARPVRSLLLHWSLAALASVEALGAPARNPAPPAEAERIDMPVNRPEDGNRYDKRRDARTARWARVPGEQPEYPPILNLVLE